MKRLALIPVLAALILAAGSCNKAENADNCGPVMTTAPAAEVSHLREYISANNISAIADSRGFYYSIRDSGGTARPTVCSSVQVNYAGRLTNQTQFDAGSQVRFKLGGLITGWKAGIPLIGAGGRITLYLPPSLAYGAAEQPRIPANSILIFEIELLQFD